MAKNTYACRSKHKHGKEPKKHVDVSTNIKFRHILAQEGQANDIKVINHGISKETCQKNNKDMLGSKNKAWKSNKAFY